MSDGQDPTRYVRVIPRLDIKGPNLVKGIHLEGLRVLGRPEQFARHYYQQGADELVYMDMVASLYGRNSLDEIIGRTAQEIFIPLTVGGGIRTLEDITRILRAGADKVAVNTAAIQRPALIREAARRFGSSTIVVSIEAMRHPDGAYEVYTHNGREPTGRDVFEWARQAAELGAGEILLTSINAEGTGKGFELELTRRVVEAVSIPVIACGGAGSVQHVREVVTEGRADAVSLASLLHYHTVKHHDTLGDVSEEGNTEYLTYRRQGFSKIQDAALPDVRAALRAAGIPCRMTAPLEATHA